MGSIGDLDTFFWADNYYRSDRRERLPLGDSSFGTIVYDHRRLSGLLRSSLLTGWGPTLETSEDLRYDGPDRCWLEEGIE